MGPTSSGRELTGNAKVTVGFQNMPRGVRTAASADGLFKEVNLRRDNVMALASEDA
jgi:hypothetical protein